MHDSVYDIAHDDRRRIALLRSSLTQLADGPDESLREMAGEVLRGDLDLRSATRSGYYADAIDARFEEFRRYYEKLSPTDRRNLIERGRVHFETLGGAD